MKSKHSKRIMSIALCMAMVLTQMAPSAFALDISDSGVQSTAVDEADTESSVSASGDVTDASSDSDSQQAVDNDEQHQEDSSSGEGDTVSALDPDSTVGGGVSGER